MNKGKLIGYSLNDKRTLSRLKKELGNDYQTAINNGYFIRFDDSGEEPIYIFTQKGHDFAWGRD